MPDWCQTTDIKDTYFIKDEMRYLKKDEADEYRCYRPVTGPGAESMSQLKNRREALTDGSIELLGIPAQ